MPDPTKDKDVKGADFPPDTKQQDLILPKESQVLCQVDSISVIESLDLVAISGTDVSGNNVSGTIGTTLWSLIKGDQWCKPGSVVLMTGEVRIAGKTQYVDSNGDVGTHTRNGFSLSRVSLGSSLKWNEAMESRKQQAKLYASIKASEAKVAIANKAKQLMKEAAEDGLDQSAMATLLAQLLS